MGFCMHTDQTICDNCDPRRQYGGAVPMPFRIPQPQQDPPAPVDLQEMADLFTRRADIAAIRVLLERIAKKLGA